MGRILLDALAALPSRRRLPLPRAAQADAAPLSGRARGPAPTPAVRRRVTRPARQPVAASAGERPGEHGDGVEQRVHRDVASTATPCGGTPRPGRSRAPRAAGTRRAAGARPRRCPPEISAPQTHPNELASPRNRKPRNRISSNTGARTTATRMNMSGADRRCAGTRSTMACCSGCTMMSWTMPAAYTPTRPAGTTHKKARVGRRKPQSSERPSGAAQGEEPRRERLPAVQHQRAQRDGDGAGGRRGSVPEEVPPAKTDASCSRACGAAPATRPAMAAAQRQSARGW